MLDIFRDLHLFNYGVTKQNGRQLSILGKNIAPYYNGVLSTPSLCVMFRSSVGNIEAEVNVTSLSSFTIHVSVVSAILRV